MPADLPVTIPPDLAALLREHAEAHGIVEAELRRSMLETSRLTTARNRKRTAGDALAAWTRAHLLGPAPQPPDPPRDNPGAVAFARAFDRPSKEP